jgi:hypothetical protein
MTTATHKAHNITSERVLFKGREERGLSPVSLTRSSLESES